MRVVPNSDDSNAGRGRRDSGVNPSALATMFLASNLGARGNLHHVGYRPGVPLRTSGHVYARASTKNAPSQRHNMIEDSTTKRRTLLSSLTKGLLGIGATSFVGKTALATASASTLESRKKLLDEISALEQEMAEEARLGENESAAIDFVPVRATDIMPIAEPISLDQPKWGWKDKALGALATLATATIAQQQMHSMDLQQQLDSLKSDGAQPLRDSDELQLQRSERDAIAAALKEAEAKLAAELEAKHSLEAKVAQKQKHVSSLEASLQDAKTSAEEELQGRVQEAMKPYAEQTRKLLSEKESVDVALKDLQAKLAAELKAKASLQAQLTQKDKDIRSLQSSLQSDGEDEKLSVELKGRASLGAQLAQKEKEISSLQLSLTDAKKKAAEDIKAAEDKAAEAKTALQTRKVLVDGLQEQVAALLMELADSEAALEKQQEINNGMKNLAEQTRALQIERNSVAATLRETETKLAAEMKAKKLLEEKVVQKELAISLLETSLKDAGAKVADEIISVEDSKVEATAALEAGKVLVNELQEKVDTLVAELAKKDAALEAQETKAAANGTAIMQDVEKHAQESRMLRFERDSIAVAMKDAEARLAAELEVKASLEATVVEKEAEIELLKESLKDAEDKAADDRIAAEKATTAARIALETGRAKMDEMQAKVLVLFSDLSKSEAALKTLEAKAAAKEVAMREETEKHAQETRALLSERTSIMVSLKEAEASLSAELRAKASLEAKVVKQEERVGSLQASLKDVESKAARDRVAVLERTAEATTALQTGKALMDELQERVTSLLSKLATSEAALKAQEAKAAAEASIMKRDIEKHAGDARALRSERDLIASALKEAEAKFAAELKVKSSLEEAVTQKQLAIASLQATLKHALLEVANQDPERKASEEKRAASTRLDHSLRDRRMVILESEVEALKNRLDRADTQTKKETEKRRRPEWQQR